MSYEQLKDYVDTERDKGASDDDIRAALEAKRWSEAFIRKALGAGVETPTPDANERTLDDHIFSLDELWGAAWKTYKAHFFRFIITSLAVLGVCFGTLAIFVSPIAYDVFFLHMTPGELFSRAMLPVMIPHIVIGVLALVLVSAWTSLAVKLMAVHRGEITVRQTLHKAWGRAPGLIWVAILHALVIIGAFFAAFIPITGLSELTFGSTNFLHVQSGLHAHAIGILVSIVSLTTFVLAVAAAGLFTLFSSFAFAAHGARGMTAVHSSVALVKPHWKQVLVRYAALFVFALVLGICANLALPSSGGFLLNVLLSPFVAIYVYTMYDNLVQRGKALEASYNDATRK